MTIKDKPANTGSEANGTTAERQFDALLRFTNLVNRADASIPSSFALTLDDADQHTQVIREDGKVYTYGYDAIGQLTNAVSSLPDGTPWSGYQFSYAYDATGNPVEQNKNGLVYSKSFNNLNPIGCYGDGCRLRQPLCRGQLRSQHLRKNKEAVLWESDFKTIEYESGEARFNKNETTHYNNNEMDRE